MQLQQLNLLPQPKLYCHTIAFKLNANIFIVAPDCKMFRFDSSIFSSSLWFICLFGMFLTITGIDLYFQSHLLVLDLEFDFYASNAPVSNML